MKTENLIVWSVLLLANLISLFPPLALSNKKWAMLIESILHVVVSCAIGYGFGSALVAVLTA